MDSAVVRDAVDEVWAEAVSTLHEYAGRGLATSGVVEGVSFDLVPPPNKRHCVH